LIGCETTACCRIQYADLLVGRSTVVHSGPEWTCRAVPVARRLVDAIASRFPIIHQSRACRVNSFTFSVFVKASVLLLVPSCILASALPCALAYDARNHRATRRRYMFYVRQPSYFVHVDLPCGLSCNTNNHNSCALRMLRPHDLVCSIWCCDFGCGKARKYFRPVRALRL
jgi:hypothetical protein